MMMMMIITTTIIITTIIIDVVDDIISINNVQCFSLSCVFSLFFQTESDLNQLLINVLLSNVNPGTK
jgi:hypothetical protein